MLTDIRAERALRRVGIRIDWRATFEAFVELHGALPVKHEGRLLFADGWGHALDSYSGPEYPPPTNPAELHALQLTYQRLKCRALGSEIEWLEGMVGSYDSLQMGRTAPLQQRKREGEKVEADVMVGMRDRLAWARDRLAEAEEEIARLSEG